MGSVRGPIAPVSSRCNVLFCRSVLVPGGGNEVPIMKSAAIVLTRYFFIFFSYGSLMEGILTYGKRDHVQEFISLLNKFW